MENTFAWARVLSLLIGYGFGLFLTAEAVVRARTGRSVYEFGSHNPGMANVMHVFGFRAGALTLAGDVLKTVAACLLCRWLFPEMGQIIVLYAGLGVCLGHNWPLWHKFRGGKGVAVTCAALILFSPLWGTAADVAGMLVVFATGYLPLGSFVIVWLFVIAAFAVHGTEAGVLAVILALIMTQRHFPGLKRVLAGKEERHAALLRRGERAEELHKRK